MGESADLDHARGAHAGRHRVVDRVGPVSRPAPGAAPLRRGLAYSTQRYDGGNFAALRSVTDGSRNAGPLYAFDAFLDNPGNHVELWRPIRAIRLPRWGEPDHPRVALTVAPSAHLRIHRRRCRAARWRRAPRSSCRGSTAACGCRRSGRSRRSPGGRSQRNAPITPKSKSSTTSRRRRCRCVRSSSRSKISWWTLFGLDMLGAPAALGHYFINNSGDVSASGMSAGLRTAHRWASARFGRIHRRPRAIHASRQRRVSLRAGRVRAAR